MTLTSATIEPAAEIPDWYRWTATDTNNTLYNGNNPTFQSALLQIAQLRDQLETQAMYLPTTPWPPR